MNEPREFWIHLSEGDAVDLASGYVPNAVKAYVLRLLDDQREDERRAARPLRKPLAKAVTTRKRGKK